MRQYAWLELYKGMWCFLTNIKGKPVNAKRKWVDKEIAIKELCEEGWILADSYQNALSAKLGLDKSQQGYSLMRTIH